MFHENNENASERKLCNMEQKSFDKKLYFKTNIHQRSYFHQASLNKDFAYV